MYLNSEFQLTIGFWWFKGFSYILYTHELYADGIGSSIPTIITSWKNGKLTLPNKSLFPKKIQKGFSGHRFLVSVAPQPPYLINK